MLESAFRKENHGFKRKGNIVKQASALHAFEWHRIVLDEAHNIKERSTNTAKAAFALKSKFKWCLSGTPLQNRVGELYSLVRFLGGDPFSFYFCERFACECAPLHIDNVFPRQELPVQESALEIREQQGMRPMRPYAHACARRVFPCRGSR